jgi:hypothetical protein
LIARRPFADIDDALIDRLRPTRAVIHAVRAAIPHLKK